MNNSDIPKFANELMNKLDEQYPTLYQDYCRLNGYDPDENICKMVNSFCREYCQVTLGLTLSVLFSLRLLDEFELKNSGFHIVE